MEFESGGLALRQATTPRKGRFCLAPMRGQGPSLIQPRRITLWDAALGRTSTASAGHSAGRGVADATRCRAIPRSTRIPNSAAIDPTHSSPHARPSPDAPTRQQRPSRGVVVSHKNRNRESSRRLCASDIATATRTLRQSSQAFSALGCRRLTRCSVFLSV